MRRSPRFALVFLAFTFPGCSPGERPSLGGPPTTDSDPDTGDTPTTASSENPTSDADPSTGSSTTHATTSTTTAADTSTSDAPNVCGDGIEGPDEACDDGPANSNYAFCTEQCQINVCGDGLKFEGVELCDEGAANSSSYGHYCGADCTPGKFCGDGLIQTDEGEECDVIGDADDVDVACDMCLLVALRGFVTRDAFTGDLGGLEGADEKCRAAALAAGLVRPEAFHAVLSTGTLSANKRFEDLLGDPLPLLLVGGKKFADSYPALMTTGPGDAGISADELGLQLLETYVATNTSPNGESATPDQDCAGWTSSSKNLFGLTGYNALGQDDPGLQSWRDEGWWIEKKPWSCDSTWFHLYCLEF